MNNAGLPPELGNPIPLGVLGMQPIQMNREMHQVPFDMLPSKGVAYPDNIEILVSPMRIRERRMLEGATQSTYYEKLIEGITVRGGIFNKRDLLFADVQFLDLVRRLFTFDVEQTHSSLIKTFRLRNTNASIVMR